MSSSRKLAASWTRHVSPFRLEQWFPKLKGLTPDSIWMNLTRGQARAIIAHFEVNVELCRHALETEFQDALAELTAQVDEKLRGASWSADGISTFARLSTLAPRDMGLRAPQLDNETRVATYKELCRQVGNSKSNPDFNLGLQCFLQATTHVLECKTGEDVVRCFLNSRRVVNELERWVAVSETEKPQKSRAVADLARDSTVLGVNIVLREWLDIPLIGEFRGFAGGDDWALNGLAQRIRFMFVPFLAAGNHRRAVTVSSRVLTFFLEEVKPRLKGTPLYGRPLVIDFALMPEADAEDVHPSARSDNYGDKEPLMYRDDVANAKIVVMDINPQPRPVDLKWLSPEDPIDNCRWFDWTESHYDLYSPPARFHFHTRHVNRQLMSKHVRSEWRMVIDGAMDAFYDKREYGGEGPTVSSTATAPVAKRVKPKKAWCNFPTWLAAVFIFLLAAFFYVVGLGVAPSSSIGFALLAVTLNQLGSGASNSPHAVTKLKE